MIDVGATIRRWTDAHVGPTALVLVYHRVADLERDPQLLAVSTSKFEAQVEMLSRDFTVVPLEDLIAGLHARRLPDRAVAVTFDDGYADNLTAAELVLAAHGVPATVFVSSGYVASGREFWWDELERLLLLPGTLPERLEFKTSSGTFSASIDTQRTYSSEEAARDADWNVTLPTRHARHEVFRDLTAFMRRLSAPDQASVLEQLRAVSLPADERAEVTARPSHRPLDRAEVAELDASPVVRVGAHTRDHLLLAAQTPDEQREEIVRDREALGSILGRPVDTFSYPYGGHGDYTDASVGIVREAGFSGACSNHMGVVKPWSDLFRLPRHLVRDWDAATLAGRMEAWFRGRP